MDFFTLNPIEIFDNLPNAGNPFSAMFLIIANGGWIAILFACLWGGWIGYLEYIRNKFNSQQEEILLAIDIPKANEQSPKAVEHIFSNLYGIIKKGNLIERYKYGYNQWCLSLEIVSIEGYIQFLIYTPKQFRDLVEAAIYAQYPEAEITEVEDYVDLIPKPLEFPHPVWDLWGSEFHLAKPDPYPLRTWPFFEHSLSQVFMDPMASLLEIMSRMGPGEHLWLQIIIAPADSGWKKKGEALINQLIGKKTPAKSNGDWMYFPREIGKGLQESITASIIPPTDMEGPNAKKTGEREWPSMMQHLSPAEREIVEAVGMKISKLGFLSKIRFIYAAKKDVLHKPKGVEAIKGALMQFNTQNLNALTIDYYTRTKIDYFFIKSRTLARKRRILWNYRYRSLKRGRRKYILNIEELASLWHFPISEVVKVPSVQTVAAKKGSAPVGTPYYQDKISNRNVDNFTNTNESGVGTSTNSKNSPPINLPFS
ncbi:MAG: hypothetical protein Q8P20_02415 [bacterium]|nr:hypothetical protein [bacterium]